MRISYLICCLIVITCFMSCVKEEEVPFPISQEKLIDVMADVHFAEAAVKDLLNLEKDSILNAYYKQIYGIHEIDSTIMDSCLVLLSNYPKTSVKVYQKVVEKLSTLQNETKEAEKKTEKPKGNSDKKENKN